ncbi:MAG: LPXTG cell wall anchor domain-containing protein [Lachnospiraceae bacterium]|nr:LPXTG cell wall anchor domain-containing protein [Lachnospiraceae bacterium]
MKRFSKALSLLVAAAVLMTTFSTSVKADDEHVDSVVQKVVLETEASGLEEDNEVIVTTVENASGETLENLTAAITHINEVFANGQTDEVTNEVGQKMVVESEETLQALEQSITGFSEALNATNISRGKIAMGVISAADYELKKPQDGSVDLTFDTSSRGGKEGDYLFVIHYPDGTNPTVAGYSRVGADGTATITNFFGDGASPFVFVLVTDVDTISTKTSPQTGETVNSLLIAAIALAAAASVVAVSGKKVTR